MIEAIIMAHPKRKDNVNKLFLQLTKDFPTKIIWDKKNNEWDTGKRCLEAATSACDWTLIIQDDAVLTPFFKENLEKVGGIVKNPTSLYLGKHNKTNGVIGKIVEDAKGYSFLALVECLHGVALLLPTKDCQEIAKEENSLDYDKKIGNFYKKRKVPIYYTLPSLVDHNDCGSLIKHDCCQRVAFYTAKKIINFTDKVYKDVL